MAQQQQQLGHKEQNLFRQLGRLYDAKQYKKALKTSEQILRKSPEHADTLAMKALTLNQLGQSDEAFALGKLALQKNMKSHICWHVYGLLYRHAKNFDEAVKAYKFALRLEPDAATILRDLAFLQIQIRDYQGYIQSRKTILQARPQLRQNWTALAVAHHLAGDLHMAEEMLKTYEGTLKQAPPRSDIEHSEAVLYKNTIIAEAGETQRALEHLDTIYKSNLDRTAVMEMRAQYLLQLGRKDEAEKAYKDLLDRNNEYRLYYEKLEEVLGLDRSKQEDLTKLKELYASYAESGGVRVDAPKRIPLDFLHGDDFRTAADSYLQRMLRKGVPSTFANIKALYADELKKKTIQELVAGYAAGKFNNESTEANGGKPDRFEESVYYFLAQNYDYYLSRDLDKAMQYIEKAIALSPKSVDYNQTKGRILKHQGDIEKAAEQMDHSRKLDEKDRYINTKCAKYQLRNNQHQIAIETMSKFTRNQTVADALGDLHDMQCMWYLFEDGQAHARLGNYGLALKRFKSIYDIFDLWQEDQFDFHHFSIRKGQIRAYVEMVRWEDRLREHPFYSRAAIAAIKIYLMLHDKPDSAHASLVNGVSTDKMDANEKKKALKKAKKEQEKREREEAEKREAEKKAAKKASSSGDGETKKVDTDPNGTKLVETETPLDDAVKYLTPLLEFSPKDIRAQNIGFEVFIRRKRYLLALKCLKAAASIDDKDPVLHEQIIRFRLALDSDSADLPPQVKEVLKSNSDIIPEKSKLKGYNESFLTEHKSSTRHILSGLKARQLLDSKSLSQNEKDLVASLKLESSDIQDALASLELLNEWKSETAVVEKCLDVGRKRWPQSSILKNKDAKAKN